MRGAEEREERRGASWNKVEVKAQRVGAKSDGFEGFDGERTTTKEQRACSGRGWEVGREDGGSLKKEENVELEASSRPRPCFLLRSISSWILFRMASAFYCISLFYSSIILDLLKKKKRASNLLTFSRLRA